MKQSALYALMPMAALFGLNATAFAANADGYILRPAVIKRADHIATYDLKKPITSGGSYIDRQGTHVIITCGSAPSVSLTRRVPADLQNRWGSLHPLALRFETTLGKNGREQTKAVLFFLRAPNTLSDNATIDKLVPNGPTLSGFCGANGKPLVPTKEQIMDWQINLDKALLQYMSKLKL